MQCNIYMQSLFRFKLPVLVTIFNLIYNRSELCQSMSFYAINNQSDEKIYCVKYVYPAMTG